MRRRSGATSVAPVARDRFTRRRWGARLQRWRWPLLLVLLLALGGAVTWVVLETSLLGVRHVDVSGVGRSKVADVAAGQVRAVVGVANGTPLARVDLDEVANAVEQLPGVASATASRDWPGSLRVDVVERLPVAAVQFEGDWQALDSTGTRFGAYEQVPDALPQLVTPGVEPAQLPAALAEAGHVLESLDPAIAARLDVVEVASRDDIVLVLASGARVRWGSAEDSAEKAAVLTVLLRIPAAVYDVTVPEQPTTSQTATDQVDGAASSDL